MSYDQGPDDVVDEWERVAREARVEVGAPGDLDGPALLARVLEELRHARARAADHVLADATERAFLLRLRGAP